MESCPFCDVVKQRNENSQIMHNRHAVALVDDSFREGHCAIILKRHIKSISEIDMSEYNSLFELITKVSKALEKKYDCEKTYLLSIGDRVEHFHFHLIPKHKDKCSMGVYCFEKLWEAEGLRHPSDTERKVLANEIKAIIENL